MNKTMIRIIAAMLMVLMLVACFAACNDDPAGPATDGTEAPGETEAPAGETEAPEQSIDDILGFEVTALNRQINIVHMNMTAVEADFIAESFDGDEVAVEVYERTLEVEEAFGITLNYIDSLGNWDTRADDKKFIETAVQSGGHDYDLMAGSNVASATMMYSGLFQNFCDLDSIDFSHSWWMPDTVETYGIGEHVYGMMGKFGHSYYSQLNLIAVNTNLVDSFNVEATHGDLYQMVYEGKWTLDKMLEIGAAYGEDNGDGTMVLGDDVYGFISTTVPSRNFLFSLGLELITLNETEDGVKIPETLDEKTINSYEKLYNAFPQAGAGSSPNYGSCAINSVGKHFAADKALMVLCYFSTLGGEEVRNMTSEYMLMPMPKYDEAQDDYITPFATTASMLLIPLTAVDAEDSAKIIEYMGYLGEKNICPVYVEQTLKLKYASDPQVMEMVQYIIDRASFTLTQAMIWNCEAGANLRNMYCFGSLNGVGSPNIASFYKSYRRVWQKQLDNICGELQ